MNVVLGGTRWRDAAATAWIHSTYNFPISSGNVAADTYSKLESRPKLEYISAGQVRAESTQLFMVRA